MAAWETTTNRLALAGWVTDAQTGAALPNVMVSIAAGPTTFTTMLGFARQKQGAQWATLSERLDRTRTASDGHFTFWYLPAGDYTLEAVWPAGGSRYTTVRGQVKIVASGSTPLLTLALPPTGVQGQVTDANGTAVMLAQVLLQDSGEYVFSDAAGHYQLLGIEAGARTLLVRLPSSDTSVSQTVTLTQGSTVTQNIQVGSGTTPTSDATAPTSFTIQSDETVPNEAAASSSFSLQGDETAPSDVVTPASFAIQGDAPAPRSATPKRSSTKKSSPTSKRSATKKKSGATPKK